MKTLKRVSMVAIVMMVLLFAACQKEPMANLNDDEAIAGENSSLSREAENVHFIATAIAANNELVPGVYLPNGHFDMLSECATVTLDMMGSIQTVVINFGTEPCLCDAWDGRYRTGILRMTLTGNLMTGGTLLTLNTENYFVGDKPGTMDQFAILMTTLNMGVNDNNNLHFKVEETVKVDFHDGGTTSMSNLLDREWIFEGDDISGNIWLVTGSGSSIRRNGNEYTMHITAPVRITSCQWPVNGVKIFNDVNSMAELTLDYGDGACDNLATIRLNEGKTKTITLGQ